jgi:threonine/homoserine/homoserine lactone efflux protein
VTVGFHDLPLFAAAALMVNLTPGPDMMFVVGSSLAHGRRSGLFAALGVGAGCLVHVAMAALGLSALLAASATLFTMVQWAGAAYLVWMGLAMLRATPPSVVAARAAQSSPVASRVFWQGALTNALNPKVALFFLAFLPQFVEPGRADQGQSLLALGLMFDIGGTLVNVIAALLAAQLRAALVAHGHGAGRRWLQRAVGALFVGLGTKLALGAR